MRARNGPLRPPFHNRRHQHLLVVTRMLRYLLLQANAAQSGNPASAAVDNNLDTRWSNEGLGSWIRLDFGSEKNGL